MTGGRCFFILTTARCGSTSLARILDAATNGTCAIEPNPNLNVESRLAMDGRLDDPARVVRTVLVPRVKAALSSHDVYGEKNLTYGPFIPEIHAQLGARFVALRRDGREVVRSLIDWHNRMFGDIYRECADPGDLSPIAVSAAANLPAWRDTSDFARPRPRPGAKWHLEWPRLSRFEMCAFYWAALNELYLDQLAKLPRDEWVELDYTEPSAAEILRTADFLGLKGLDESNVQSMLDARINSLKDRCDESPQFPAWTDWHGGLRRQFERFAGATMRRLGYWTDDRSPWRTPGAESESSTSAPDAHIHALTRWLNEETGRGRAYRNLVSLGGRLPADLASTSGVLHVPCPQVVAGNGARSHIADLAVSCGALDASPDIESHLDAVVDAARKAIFITCSAPPSSNTDEHVYHWSKLEKRYHAAPSPRRVREHLEARGCGDIILDRAARGGLRITARAPEGGTP